MENFKSISSEAQNELISLIIERLEEKEKNETLDLHDLHNETFNQDYFLIGYYQCEEWIKKHTKGSFSVIESVQEYEKDNFGETTTEVTSEKILNMFVYICGEEIIWSLDEEKTASELIEDLKNLLND